MWSRSTSSDEDAHMRDIASVPNTMAKPRTKQLAVSALHLKPSCGTQGPGGEDLISTVNAISVNGHDPLVCTSPCFHNNSDASVTILPPS